MKEAKLKTPALLFFSSELLNIILHIRKANGLGEIIDHARLNRKRMHFAGRWMNVVKGLLLWVILIVCHKAPASPNYWVSGPARNAFVESLPEYAIRRIDIKCEDRQATLVPDGGYVRCEDFDKYMALKETRRDEEAARLMFFP